MQRVLPSLRRGSGPRLAALWIVVAGLAVAAPAHAAPKVFVSPNGSDSRSCKSPRTACASFDRAYRVARPGQVVRVAAGSYPGQTIRGVSGRRGPRIAFRPASRARVVLGGLTFSGADYVTVERMQTRVKQSEPGAGNREGIFVGPGSHHIRLARMVAGSISTWKADHVLVRGGRYGPCHAVWNASNVCDNNKIDVSTNVTIRGAVFHDFRFDQSCFGGDCHWECMYVNGGRNVTIKRSKFYNCALYDIFVTLSGDDARSMGHRRLRIQGNWFDTPWTEERSGGARARATAVSLAWCPNSPNGYRDVFLRFNSFQRNTGIDFDNTGGSCVFEGVRVIGNMMGNASPCDSRIRYAYNLLSRALRRGRCSRTEQIGGNRLPYAKQASGRGLNFHLRRGARTAADNRVPRSVYGGCSGRDIDAQRRPLQRRCDIGADERRM
jgi:hypothetical protein